MGYSIQQLARVAGISVRTLHHYDTIGLLRPARQARNSYREYTKQDLLVLQQILFFRELEFPLEQIRTILTSPNFDMHEALRTHRHLVMLKKKRLTRLVRTIDTTIAKLTHEITMEDKELYGSFSNEEVDAYASEAKERWGNTDAYKQSQQRVQRMTKADWEALSKRNDAILRGIVTHMDKGAASPEVQQFIAQHYDALRAFYEPNLVIYRGLADMYVSDSRFAAYYEKYDARLPAFMRDAMHAYADSLSSEQPNRS